MKKVTHLKEVAPAGHHVQRTPEEALEEAIGMLKSEGYDAEQVLVIILTARPIKASLHIAGFKAAGVPMLTYFGIVAK